MRTGQVTVTLYFIRSKIKEGGWSNTGFPSSLILFQLATGIWFWNMHCKWFVYVHAQTWACLFFTKTDKKPRLVLNHPLAQPAGTLTMPLVIKAIFVVISTETIIYVYLDWSRLHHLNHIFIGVLGGEWACTRSLRKKK